MPSNFLVTGFGNPQDQPRGPDFGPNVLGRNDDESTVGLDISEVFRNGGFKFFGTTYSTIYINNNGNVTFGGPLSEFQPLTIGSGTTSAIIAPFWMDVDTELSGRPDEEFDTGDGAGFDYGGAGNDTLQPGIGNISSGGNSAGTDLVYWNFDDGYRDGPPEDPTITVTWDDVGSFASDNARPNAFQLQIIQNDDDTFDIVFRYEATQQATSATNDANHAARAGYAPDGIGNGFEIAGSGIATSMEQLASTIGNTGEAGYWIFHVDANGDITNPLPPAQYNQPEGYPQPVVGPVSFSVGGDSIHNEGNFGITPFNLIIERSGTRLDDVSVVDWAITVEDPTDLSPDQPLSGSVTFAPFQTTATVTIDVQGDRLYEPDEDFGFRLVNATFGGQSWDPNLNGAVIILNDDPRTNYVFSGPQIRLEGTSGATPFDFLVQRSGDLTFASTVHWELQPGTADAEDLVAGQPTSGDITFAAGAAIGSIEVQVQGDAKVELDEAFTLTLTSTTTAGLTNPLDVSTTGTIIDDDARATRLVATPTVVVAPEGDSGASSFSFTIMRTGDLSAAASTPYAVVLSPDGASAADLDSPLAGTLSFAAGASQATLTIKVQADDTPEDNEAFSVTLGGGVFNNLSLTGVILNDDKAAIAGVGTSAASDGDGSWFMNMLTGGGLWSDGFAL